MQQHPKYISIFFISVLSAGLLISCKKLVTIPPPKDKLTTVQMFNTESQAENALAGIYSNMINGPDQTPTGAIATFWSAGLSTLLGGLSSDEIYVTGGSSAPEFYPYNINKLKLLNSSTSDKYWRTAYLSIYGANAVIEGIAASTSTAFRESARKKLTAEAKFIRALSYFYLTNFFGDVPLVLTIDFHKTASMTRTSQQEIYRQIIEDLKEAQTELPVDYPKDPELNTDRRVRPNKYAAAALLARCYLYQGNMNDAVSTATLVIDQHALYTLEADLNQTFLKTSREAIWQLMQTDRDPNLQNATPEGYTLLPSPFFTGTSNFRISDELMSAFESGDKRRRDWIDSTDNTYASTYLLTFYPTKYKTGRPNLSMIPPDEYYMVLRLAELFLIRAEANAKGGLGGLAAAIDDLNIIRKRAGLDDLPKTLNNNQVLAAIAKERQLEFFCEWGHRWFDLKRTGKASEVLSAIPLKQPWEGDHQLLYPIPVSEIQSNSKLVQNPGYF